MKLKRLVLIVAVAIVLLALQVPALAACNKCYNGENEWYFICNGDSTSNGTDTHIVWFSPFIDKCTRSLYTSNCTAYCRYCNGKTSAKYMSHLCYREHSYCSPSYESMCQYP